MLGVQHVIDTGFVQTPVYGLRTGEMKLEEVMISKASAKQRAGRAARECNGLAWRLYTEREYQGLEEHARAGVLTTDLTPLLWKLSRMRVTNLIGFCNDFLDPPDSDMMEGALTRFFQLNLLKTGLKGGEVALTELGSVLMNYPAYLGCEEAIALYRAKVPSPPCWPCSRQHKPRRCQYVQFRG